MSFRTWWKWWAGFDIACVVFVAVEVTLAYGAYRWWTRPAQVCIAPEPPRLMVEAPYNGPRAHKR